MAAFNYNLFAASGKVTYVNFNFYTLTRCSMLVLKKLSLFTLGSTRYIMKVCSKAKIIQTYPKLILEFLN